MALDLCSSEPYLDSHISRKRRRCQTEESESSIDDDQRGVRQLLAEEFDLEISLRQRLAATIESRITWALLLQDSLEKDLPATDCATSSHFQDVALEAMDAIDTHSNFLFERELPFAALEPWVRSFSPKVAAPPQPQQPSRTLKPRGAVRSHRGNTKLLFVRNATIDPPVVAKMVCPDCARFDFTNLQGLLNHCRLRHKRDFGSHDECMQKCAVLVPAEDQDWVLAQGTELGGVSQPSLRRLFEIAVGADMDIVDIVPEQRDLLETEQTSTPQSRDPAPSTHLSRTLGHHIDTPALAPFLGRAPKRRCINVYDDETVDITSLDKDSEDSGTVPWRMSYSHRNNARQELDTVVDLPCPQPQSQHQPQPQPSPPPQPKPQSISLVNTPTDAKLPPIPVHSNTNPGTRFHITARVIITDYSLWLRTNRANVAQDISHRWMLGVSSPSYVRTQSSSSQYDLNLLQSLHITAFLCQMTVTCLSQPPPSSLAVPIVVTEPPFAVMGTSDRPFLARLTLVWVGKQNASMEVEHWVELDPFKSTSAVLGEEQVLDIELDRHTQLLPVRTDLKLPTLQRESTKREATPPNASSSKADDTAKGYAAVLKSLLPRVPMTMKDVKGRPPSQLPYKLTSSPSHFSTLVPGRRKAIEWGRARALHSLYDKQIGLFPSGGAVSLTTGDVYCWLEDEGYFIRPAAIVPQNPTVARVIKKSTVNSAQSAQSEICSLCGIKCRLHPSYAVKNESSGQAFVCDIVQDCATQPPFLNLKGVFGSALDYALRPPVPTSSAPTIPEELHHSARSKLSRYSSRDIISLVPPSLITAVCGIANMTHTVPFAPHGNRRSLDQTTLSSESRKSTEDRMAPYALVSAALKSFVAVLVHRGLDTARWDMTRALLEGRRKTKSCILTPSHIIRGIRSGLMTDTAQTSTALCLTRLAVPSVFGRDFPEDVQEDEGKSLRLDEVLVKIENDY
ncbi:hypothetical protein SERLA73DRAFT_78206 [Serpula lacrymans var. lacrymans S7.3]|uniref:YEATS domain-containing protein n=1 Tax=Serpula lacrymans var. lacrymans (strain S7.3) TaxID=936435 RepID=F8QCG6_SERL3|nr:hypothetical protein SERLA73DRAFT_78206 [Serpula lacrymans var. lacrymans S7.3]